MRRSINILLFASTFLSEMAAVTSQNAAAKTVAVTHSPVASVPRMRAATLSPSPVASGPRMRAATLSPSPVASGPRMRAATLSPSPVASGPRMRAATLSPSPVRFTSQVRAMATSQMRGPAESSAIIGLTAEVRSSESDDVSSPLSMAMPGTEGKVKTATSQNTQTGSPFRTTVEREESKSRESVTEKTASSSSSSSSSWSCLTGSVGSSGASTKSLTQQQTSSTDNMASATWTASITHPATSSPPLENSDEELLKQIGQLQTIAVILGTLLCLLVLAFVFLFFVPRCRKQRGSFDSSPTHLQDLKIKKNQNSLRLSSYFPFQTEADGQYRHSIPINASLSDSSEKLSTFQLQKLSARRMEGISESPGERDEWLARQSPGQTEELISAVEDALDER